jgi:choline dehydrogenase-like flavoprotein
LVANLEMRARPENRVVPSAQRDARGVPLAEIHVNHSADEHRLAEDAGRTLNALAAAAGATIEKQSPLSPPGLNAHEVGGARMGSTPRDSVVDAGHLVWGTENLFVADGSCFVTNGWKNPTLTMMALAGRAALAVRERLA